MRLVATSRYRSLSSCDEMWPVGERIGRHIEWFECSPDWERVNEEGEWDEEEEEGGEEEVEVEDEEDKEDEEEEVEV